jgi:hypothetical protein
VGHVRTVADLPARREGTPRDWCSALASGGPASIGGTMART